MTKTTEAKAARLNRERVLLAAVAMADRDGLAAVSMRNLADHLNVVPMALYKHVADKDALLDGMVDTIIGELPEPPTRTGASATRTWKRSARERILSTRAVLLHHPWARSAIESRTTRTTAALEYLDSVAHIFIAGGLSPDLVHHAMHAIGSRVWGFTQDVFDSANDNPTPIDAETMATLRARFPDLATVADAVGHDHDSVVGPGCDDQFEFEFALDLLLDGIERLHKARWSSRATKR